MSLASSESDKGGRNEHLSQATSSVSSMQSLQRNSDAEKRLLRKIDLNVLPILTLLYLLSFLDRSNIGNARLEGLTTDLHISNDNYLWTLTIYFFGYVIFEVPSNIVLKQLKPSLWLPTIMLLWGIVGVTMGLVHNFGGLLVTRFFLGLTEAGLFPGVVYVLSMWYTRQEQHYRVALFFSAAALSGAFGGVLAFGIGKMSGIGGKAGWAWIFIIESLLTIVVAVFAYFLVHDYPDTARFLNAEEKELCRARLAASGDATDIEPFSWPNVVNALKDISVWIYTLLFVGLSLPLYTLSLFLPTIIKNLGYTAANAQLLTVPPYAFAFVTTALAAHFSFVLRRRAIFIIAGCILAGIGYIVLLADHKVAAQYAGVMVAAGGIYPAVAIALAWPANNVSGQTKRAVACALQISIGILFGATPGTQVYRPKQSPKYPLGHGMALGFLAFTILAAATQWALLAARNRAKSKARHERGAFATSPDEAEPDQEKRLGHIRSRESERGLGDRSIYWIYQL